MSNAKLSAMIYPILRPSRYVPVAALVTLRTPVEGQREHGKGMHCGRPCKYMRALLDVVIARSARAEGRCKYLSVMPAEHSPGQRALTWNMFHFCSQ